MTNEAKPRTYTDPEGQEYDIVWSGDMKVSLTGPRSSKAPNYIEPDNQDETKVTRKYTLSGRYVGLYKKRATPKDPDEVAATPQAEIDWGLD